MLPFLILNILTVFGVYCLAYTQLKKKFTLDRKRNDIGAYSLIVQYDDNLKSDRSPSEKRQMREDWYDNVQTFLSATRKDADRPTGHNVESIFDHAERLSKNKDKKKVNK